MRYFTLLAIFLLSAIGMNSLVADESRFCPVGHPNNKKDSLTHLGSVPYVFSISAYETTAKEYCDFLNAIASKSDPHELYNPSMSSDPQACSIICLTIDHEHQYIPMEGREEFPICFTTLYSAARYCNWLQNKKPTDNEGPKTTETGSYDLTQVKTKGLVRTEGATYFLPTENEWYKAAYFNPKNGTYYAFPNRSSWSPSNIHLLQTRYNNEANYDYADASEEECCLTPVGMFSTSMSPCGAFDMGGNVSERTETPDSKQTKDYIIRGGSWQSRYNNSGINDLESTSHTTASPLDAYPNVGFRIVQLGTNTSKPMKFSSTPDAGWLTPSTLEDATEITAGIIICGTILATTYKFFYASAEVIETVSPSLIKHTNKENVNSYESLSEYAGSSIWKHMKADTTHTEVWWKQWYTFFARLAERACEE